MSGAKRAWIVAASIGAVEAMKDQGVCRWNYALRSMQQYAKTRVQSYYPTRILPAAQSGGGVVGNKMVRINKTENSFNKVMDLSCWGPATVRF